MSMNTTELVQAVAKIIDEEAFDRWRALFEYELNRSGNADMAKDLANAFGRDYAEARRKAARCIDLIRENPKEPK